MEEDKKYLPRQRGSSIQRVYALGGKAEIALELIRTYGAIAGKRGQVTGPDNPGIDLQTPEELVERCFKIADLFFDMAERRGEIVPTPDMFAPLDR